ncbi:MAG: GDSL-type esterase/lipase family protein [Desulforegulaceae bacterium]|nr:GDSL-type esterase/lipase family protein [Desulforegulaceae bacterium]
MLHVLLVLVLAKSDFIEKVGYKLGVSTTPELSSYYDRITTYHFRMDGNVPDGATLFIGDSITQGLATSAIANPSVNYGIGSDTTLGVLNRIRKYDSLNRADAVVLAIGLNDLSRRSDEKIVTNYKKILDSISEEIPVVVSAILPVDERVQRVNSENKRISKVNKLLRDLSLKYDNVTFSDAGVSLRDSDNNLKSDFHVGDGVHLSSAGYQVWIRELRRALNNA